MPISVIHINPYVSDYKIFVNCLPADATRSSRFVSTIHSDKQKLNVIVPATSKAVAPFISRELATTVSLTVTECPDRDLSLQSKLITMKINPKDAMLKGVWMRITLSKYMPRLAIMIRKRKPHIWVDEENQMVTFEKREENTTKKRKYIHTQDSTAQHWNGFQRGPTERNGEKKPKFTDKELGHKKTYDSGTQTWTSNRPSATRASTSGLKPGPSMPSPLVTRMMGFDSGGTVLLSAGSADEEDGSGPGLGSSSPPSPPAFLPLSTFWRLARSDGGRWLFLIEVELVVMRNNLRTEFRRRPHQSKEILPQWGNCGREKEGMGRQRRDPPSPMPGQMAPRKKMKRSCTLRRNKSRLRRSRGNSRIISPPLMLPLSLHSLDSQ